MRLTIGATIHCRDGAAGQLTYVVLDPDNGAVTDLIVGRGGELSSDMVVPAVWIEEATDVSIAVNATVAELAVLPEYHEFDFINPDPGYCPVSGQRVEETRMWVSAYGLISDLLLNNGRPRLTHSVQLTARADEILLRRGLAVHTSNGRPAGTIDHLVIDGSCQRLTHLVLQRNGLVDTHWMRQTVIVPVEQVIAVTAEGVQLALTATALDQAPLYLPPASDAQLTRIVQRALETDRRTRRAGLHVEIQEGVVRFCATAVASIDQSVLATARSLARHRRGVIGFADELYRPELPLPTGTTMPVLAGRYGKLTKRAVYTFWLADLHHRRKARLHTAHRLSRTHWRATGQACAAAWRRTL